MTKNALTLQQPRSVRLARYTLYLCTLAVLVFSLRSVEVIPEFLYDAPEQVVDLLERMWPLEWPYFFSGLSEALIETLHIATLGTLLTLCIALPVGILGSKRLVPNAGLNFLSRFICVSSRSINSLVWALLFVAIVGPGALAGVLAITFRSIGFVGKLFQEALDTLDDGPVTALKATGAPWSSVFIKAYWPQVSPAFWSIAFFRWDINVRESAVLGLVGAGGIGMALSAAMDLFYWDRVGLILLAILTVVLLAEILVNIIRAKIL